MVAIERVVDDVRQAGDPLVDLARCQAGKSDQDASPGQRAGGPVVGRRRGERVDAHPLRQRELLEARRLRARRPASRQKRCRPAGLAADLNRAEIASQRGEQSVAPLFVDCARRSREVRAVAAAAQELGQRRLIQPGVAAVEEGLDGARGVDQGRRDDDVAETEAGAERRRKRAEVDGAVGRAPRHRLHRRAVVLVRAVVVVFDDIAAGAPGPGDRLRPTIGGECVARSGTDGPASGRAASPPPRGAET